MNPLRRTCAAAAVMVAVAGCGGGDPVPTAATPSVQPRSAACVPAPYVAPSPAAGAVDLKTKPVITLAERPPPCKLDISDLVVGKGAAARSGQQVSMQYVGVTYADGRQFDASWDRGAEPFAFTLGGRQVIRGWDDGIVGMKVGGRRQLVIPPDLGYGEQGRPPAIAGGATLVFIVDLVAVG